MKLPSGVNGIINALGNCNTAMSMLVIGMILERLKLKEMWDKTVLIYSLHRLIIIPGLSPKNTRWSLNSRPNLLSSRPS